MHEELRAAAGLQDTQYLSQRLRDVGVLECILPAYRAEARGFERQFFSGDPRMKPNASEQIRTVPHVPARIDVRQIRAVDFKSPSETFGRLPRNQWNRAVAGADIEDASAIRQLPEKIGPNITQFEGVVRISTRGTRRQAPTSIVRFPVCHFQSIWSRII